MRLSEKQIEKTRSSSNETKLNVLQRETSLTPYHHLINHYHTNSFLLFLFFIFLLFYTLFSYLLFNTTTLLNKFFRLFLPFISSYRGPNRLPLYTDLQRT